ncbi:hypothetical protein ACTXT7_007523 [Hymenolepis weldensis]
MDAFQNTVSSLAGGTMVEGDLPVSMQTDALKKVKAGAPDITTVMKKGTEDSAAVVAANRVRRSESLLLVTAALNAVIAALHPHVRLPRIDIIVVAVDIDVLIIEAGVEPGVIRDHKVVQLVIVADVSLDQISLRNSLTKLMIFLKINAIFPKTSKPRAGLAKGSGMGEEEVPRIGLGKVPVFERVESGRTPSYRPPLRRRPFGRPRRFSPPFSRRGRGGPTRRSPAAHHIRPSPVRTRPPSPPPMMQRFRPTKSSPPPAPMPLLSVRFENVVKSTLRRGLREYGVLGGLAHLILTNRSKLPLPTLMREAKELSVVIERNLPSDIADPNAKISFNVDMGVKLLIPYPPNAGAKPVFDRPEIPVYKTADDEKKIVEQIAAALKAEQAENHTGDTNNRIGVIPERNQRIKRGSAFSRLGPLNPLEVPKGSAYFMHDDRDDPYQSGRGRNFRGGRRRRDDDYQGSRRGKNDRGAGRSNRFSRDEGQWCHDKFLELEEVGKGGGGGGSKNGHRSSRHSSRGSFASSHHSENNKMFHARSSESNHATLNYWLIRKQINTIVVATKEE